MTDVYKPSPLDRKIAEGLAAHWRREPIEDPFMSKLVTRFREIEVRRFREGQPLSDRMYVILGLWGGMLPPVPESGNERADAIFNDMIDSVMKKPNGTHAQRLRDRMARGLPPTITDEERAANIRAADNRNQFKIVPPDKPTQD